MTRAGYVGHHAIRYWVIVSLELLVIVALTGCTKKEPAATPKGETVEKRVAVAAAACPTPRPKPAWVPPDVDYCTQARFYITRCETSPWIQMYRGEPGRMEQGCSEHTYIVSTSNGFRYPIRGQDGQHRGTLYQKPPADAPEALAVWKKCYERHEPLGGGYPCDVSEIPPAGTLTYVPKRIAELPPADRDYWFNFYACCNVVPPTPTVPPVTVPPVTVPPGPTVTPGGCRPGSVVIDGVRYVPQP